MANSASPRRLACQGGDPEFPEGPPDWPLPDEDILAALQAAYADGSWGRYDGPHVQRLCDQLAARHGVQRVRCVCSGTAAVELALRGLQVGAGDEVILAGYDFPGNFRAIEAVGATPVLAEIMPQHWCPGCEQLDAAYDTRVRAVIVSHLHGAVAPMPAICEWAAQRNVQIVEDACQATGAVLYGKPAGAWGDVGVVSFGGSKLLTAGRGGAVLTDRADVEQRITIFADRGNKSYPLSELQAAVLLPQLAKLDERNELRWKTVQRLLDQLVETPGLRPVSIEREIDLPGFYKVGWLFDAESSRGWTRESFLAAAQAEGVPIDVGFQGFHRRSSRRCRRPVGLEACEQAADSTVLLHHPILLQGAMAADRVAVALQKVFDGAAP